jgi:hypothetical protein
LAALRADRAAQAGDAIRRGSVSNAMEGLMELDWQWASIRAERVQKAAEGGGAWSRDGGREILITGRHSAEGEPGMRLQAVGADVLSAAEILRASRRLAFEEGLPSVRWLAPVGDEIEAALVRAGFSRVEEDPLLIYARAR